MKASLGNSIHLALDCVRTVASTHLFVQGWLCWPQDAPTPDLAVAAAGMPLQTQHFTLYDRPDILVMAEGGSSAKGFVLISRLPGAPGADGFDLVLQSDDAAAGVALPAAAHGPALAEMLGQAHWNMVFDLLAAVARDPRLGCLLHHGGGRLGAFARWLATVPLVPSAADGLHGIGRLDAIAAPSGECAVALTLPAPFAEATELRILALLPHEDGVGLHLLAGPAPLRGEAFLAFYGRLPAEVALPAPAPELLVELRRPEGLSWFRTQPRSLDAPVFLETLRRLAGGGAAGDAMHGFAWLRGVLEDREAGLAPLAPPTARAAAADAPVVAVLHAVDDPFAPRLALLAAAAIERHAAEVLVLGPPAAAEAVADIFLQRGRIPARISFDLAAAVRRGTYARCALVPIDALALGDALVGAGVDALFAQRMDGGALPALLRLAAVAGTLDGAETMGRLAQVLEGGAASLRFGRSEGAFGQLLGEHLAGFWHDAAPALAAAHGPA